MGGGFDPDVHHARERRAGCPEGESKGDVRKTETCRLESLFGSCDVCCGFYYFFCASFAHKRLPASRKMKMGLSILWLISLQIREELLVELHKKNM